MHIFVPWKNSDTQICVSGTEAQLMKKFTPLHVHKLKKHISGDRISNFFVTGVLPVVKSKQNIQ